MSFRYDCADPAGRGRGLARARTVLGEGELVVLPTESAYGIACDAFSPAGVAALRAAKGNPRLRPPVLVGNAHTLDGVATGVGQAARELIAAFWPGPLTLVCHAQPTLDWDVTGADGVLSLRMPLHPVALQLLAEVGPMALTAANAPGHPLPLTYEDAHDQLGEQVAVYLDAGPATYGGPSTVVDVRGPIPQVLRRGDVTTDQLREVVPNVVDLLPSSDLEGAGA